jgi:hypothetical protein
MVPQLEIVGLQISLARALSADMSWKKPKTFITVRSRPPIEFIETKLVSSKLPSFASRLSSKRPGLKVSAVPCELLII